MKTFKPSALSRGTKRLADPGLVRLLLAVAYKDVVDKAVGGLLGRGRGRRLAALVERDRIIVLELDLQHRTLVGLVGDDLLLDVGVQVEDADDAAVAASRAAEPIEEVAGEDAVLRPFADISRIGPPGRRDDDPARAGLQHVEIVIREPRIDPRGRDDILRFADPAGVTAVEHGRQPLGLDGVERRGELRSRYRRARQVLVTGIDHLDGQEVLPLVRPLIDLPAMSREVEEDG